MHDVLVLVGHGVILALLVLGGGFLTFRLGVFGIRMDSIAHDDAD